MTSDSKSVVSPNSTNFSATNLHSKTLLLNAALELTMDL